jgi:hypothetical protein
MQIIAFVLMLAAVLFALLVIASARQLILQNQSPNWILWLSAVLVFGYVLYEIMDQLL